ncbi:hypothetical protein GCM10020254_11130 [Streptomyces goshikiensis]
MGLSRPKWLLVPRVRQHAARMEFSPTAATLPGIVAELGLVRTHGLLGLRSLELPLLHAASAAHGGGAGGDGARRYGRAPWRRCCGTPWRPWAAVTCRPPPPTRSG